MSEIKGFLSVQSVFSALSFFFGFFVCLRALSVRSGYLLRLSFVCVIEIALGLCTEEERSEECLSSFVMMAFFTVRGCCELKCRMIFFYAFFCVEFVVNLSVVVNFHLCVEDRLVDVRVM